MKLCIRGRWLTKLRKQKGSEVAWVYGCILKFSCTSQQLFLSLFWDKMFPRYLIKWSTLRKQKKKKFHKSILLSLSHFLRCGEQQWCGLVFRPCCRGGDSCASDRCCHSLPKEPERVRCWCHRLLRADWGLPVVQLQDLPSRWASNW